MHYGVSTQPDAQGHRCRRTAVSKQCLGLSPSQKHEQLPQNNGRHGYQQTIDQRSKVHGDGLRKHVFFKLMDRLYVRYG